ncbi:MAG: hypothetical protein P8Y97_18380 [Candidatus Lokiarchaeota archaeon]
MEREERIPIKQMTLTPEIINFVEKGLKPILNQKPISSMLKYLNQLSYDDFLKYLREYQHKLFLVRASAVHATEREFFSVNHFAVASFVNFAAAVGANVEAYLII